MEKMEGTGGPMTYFTVCCGYASHYQYTVTVEANSLDEALEKAIEQASDDPHWKSVDQASQTFVEALAEGMDAEPWGNTAVPVADRFTGEPANGEPSVVTPAGHRPPAASRPRAAPSAFVSSNTPVPSRVVAGKPAEAVASAMPANRPDGQEP